MIAQGLVTPVFHSTIRCEERGCGGHLAYKVLHEIPGHKCPACKGPMLIWFGRIGARDVDPDEYHLCCVCIARVLAMAGVASMVSDD